MSRRATVDTARLLDVVRTEAQRVIVAARDAAPDAQVPACPGLRLGDTVRHLGGMYRASLAWIRTGERPTRFARRPAEGQSTESFLEEGLTELLAELSAHQPMDHCATWWPADETYGFWCRRLAHETTVHRIDVQGAANLDPDPVAVDIALDGIDEVLTLWFGRRLATLGLSGNRYASVEVRAGGRRWLAVASPQGTSAEALADGPELRAWQTPEELAEESAERHGRQSGTRSADQDAYDWAPPDAPEPGTTEPDSTEPDTAEPDTADSGTAGPGTAEPDTAGPGDPDGTAWPPAGSAATVSADPAQMYLWLWGRRPLYGGAVTVTGDDDAVAQLWALLRLATR